MNRIWSFLLLLLMVSCNSPKSNNFIHVQGMDLIAPSGEIFFIRGTNLGHWLNPEGYLFQIKNANSPNRLNQAFCEMVGPHFVCEFWKQFKDNYITKADIEYLASTGINTLRIPFHYKLFTDEDYLGLTSHQDGFTRIDNLVNWCREFGLYLILDMHDAPAGQTGDNIDDSYGYPWLFESEAAQQQFIDIWVRIAEHYAQEPVILGYDLMNEPIATYFDNKNTLNLGLEPLFKRTVAAIREKDKNHIILLAGAQWNGTFESVFNDWTYDDNIMFTCHRYGNPPTTEGIQDLINFRDKTQLPMYMGEIGENKDEWVAAMRKTLEENNIGWTFWPYKKLGHPSCFVQVPVPENWNLVVEFANHPRETYQTIREIRPDVNLTRKALNDYLENCKFGHCIINQGYVDALTK